MAKHCAGKATAVSNASAAGKASASGMPQEIEASDTGTEGPSGRAFASGSESPREEDSGWEDSSMQHRRKAAFEKLRQRATKGSLKEANPAKKGRQKRSQQQVTVEAGGSGLSLSEAQDEEGVDERLAHAPAGFKRGLNRKRQVFNQSVSQSFDAV